MHTQKMIPATIKFVELHSDTILVYWNEKCCRNTNMYILYIYIVCVCGGPCTGLPQLGKTGV